MNDKLKSVTNSQHLARQTAVQALYQYSLRGQQPSEIEDSFIFNKKLSGKYKQFFFRLIRGIAPHTEDIDRLFDQHLDRAKEQLDLVTLAVLRIGAFELAHQPGTPMKVIINESIDLAKEFGAEQGYKYINGVLDKVAKEVRGNQQA
ncbi:MAG: transcription antitermination factor NusB [Gammaproteobacteria bacterium]|nr:transcription antitermination factor NusB [Gammaproteobacteria bacterium]MCY4228847.1 transcription antitermination factor NusB [Gammaproteobacteria bacterium]MCY4314024.1 transcription antitermination factor NusB [Gammaproteobacteria bacterium]